MLLDDRAVFLRFHRRRRLAMRHRLNGRLMDLRRRGWMRHDARLRHCQRAFYRRMPRCGRFARPRLNDVRRDLNLWPHGGWMHRRDGLHRMRLYRSRMHGHRLLRVRRCRRGMRERWHAHRLLYMGRGPLGRL